MTDTYRMDRIERLLHELEYEITRGLHAREIDERLHFRFMVPFCADSKNDCVVAEFRMRPELVWLVDDVLKPRLRLVKRDEQL